LAFSAIGVSHDRRLEICDSTNALYHLYVHVVRSNRRGAAGVFLYSIHSEPCLLFIFYQLFLIDERR
jgi:hypothetical protein